MKRAMVDPKMCNNCDICEVDAKCMEKAVIREDKTDKPYIDFYKCRGCMKCKQYCKYSSILEETKPCDRNFLKSW